MSTEAFKKEAEDARRTLGRLAARVKGRAKDVRVEITGLVAERGNVEIGHRAAMRDIDDELEECAEEAEQLRSVLEGLPLIPRTPRIEEPTPEPTPDVPAADTAGNTPPDPPPAPAVAEPAPAAPAPAPVAPATAPVPAVAVVVNTPPQTPWGWVRTWRLWAWVLAFVLLVVGLVVGSDTAGFDPFAGFGHGLFTALWVVACACAGFFIGGLIGQMIDDRRRGGGGAV